MPAPISPFDPDQALDETLAKARISNIQRCFVHFWVPNYHRHGDRAVFHFDTNKSDVYYGLSFKGGQPHRYFRMHDFHQEWELELKPSKKSLTT